MPYFFEKFSDLAFQLDTISCISGFSDFRGQGAALIVAYQRAVG
jgi:hypothetical protein